MDGYGRNSLLGNYGGASFNNMGSGSQASSQTIEDAAFAARVLDLTSNMMGGGVGGGSGAGGSYGQQQQQQQQFGGQQQDVMSMRYQGGNQGSQDGGYNSRGSGGTRFSDDAGSLNQRYSNDSRSVSKDNRRGGQDNTARRQQDSWSSRGQNRSSNDRSHGSQGGGSAYGDRRDDRGGGRRRSGGGGGGGQAKGDQQAQKHQADMLAQAKQLQVQTQLQLQETQMRMQMLEEAQRKKDQHMLEMDQMLRKRKLDEELAMMAAMKQPRLEAKVPRLMGDLKFYESGYGGGMNRGMNRGQDRRSKSGGGGRDRRDNVRGRSGSRQDDNKKSGGKGDSKESNLLHADVVAKYGKQDAERAYFKEMNMVADSLWNLKELEAAVEHGKGHQTLCFRCEEPGHTLANCKEPEDKVVDGGIDTVSQQIKMLVDKGFKMHVFSKKMYNLTCYFCDCKCKTKEEYDSHMESSKHKKLADEVKSGHVGDPKRIPLVMRLNKLPTIDVIKPEVSASTHDKDKGNAEKKKPEGKTEEKKEDKAEDKSEDKAEDKTEDKAEDKTEDIAEDKTEDKPTDDTDDKPEEVTEDKADDQSGDDKPAEEAQVDGEGDAKTEDKSEEKVEENGEEAAEDKPKDKTEDKTDADYGYLCRVCLTAVAGPMEKHVETKKHQFKLKHGERCITCRLFFGARGKIPQRHARSWLHEKMVRVTRRENRHKVKGTRRSETRSESRTDDKSTKQEKSDKPKTEQKTPTGIPRGAVIGLDLLTDGWECKVCRRFYSDVKKEVHCAEGVHHRYLMDYCKRRKMDLPAVMKKYMATEQPNLKKEEEEKISAKDVMESTDFMVVDEAVGDADIATTEEEEVQMNDEANHEEDKPEEGVEADVVSKGNEDEDVDIEGGEDEEGDPEGHLVGDEDEDDENKSEQMDEEDDSILEDIVKANYEEVEQMEAEAPQVEETEPEEPVKPVGSKKKAPGKKSPRRGRALKKK